MVKANASTKARFAILCQSIRETQPGGDVAQLIFNTGLGTPLIVVLASVNYSDGGVGIALRFGSRHETGSAPLRLRVGNEGIPPKTGLEG